MAVAGASGRWPERGCGDAEVAVLVPFAGNRDLLAYGIVGNGFVFKGWSFHLEVHIV